MNEANRTAIVLLAAAWIVLMAIVVFLAWAAPGDSIEALGDLVQEMEQNNDTAGRLVVTLGALALAVFALLVIILELAPEDEERELKVKQAGSTTIVPAMALRERLEEAIGGIPEVTSVKARVWTRENAIATNLDLGLVPRANVANVTQEASRIVVDIIQTELGLPVAGLPDVRVSFGGEKPQPVAAAATVDQPSAASSMYQRPSAAPSRFERPQPRPEVDPREMLGGADDAPPSEPPVMDATEGTADSSPGPLVYDEPRRPEGEPSASGEEPGRPEGQPGVPGEEPHASDDQPGMSGQEPSAPEDQTRKSWDETSRRLEELRRSEDEPGSRSQQ